ncbi:DUF3828 domain-containing protein [Methylobacterium sp. WL103]|uniref:DUF3828 domain-containing protein n=1 Tax=Methylobacterium sp. WL103 TaxID=2603891 RepID=UPI0011C868AF|nr:DUF3828 domain-containing protein [Methylobacterium sp. WL103]TXN06408.1 DUF3828 domain-containing protein [Methylobacterium sp. WL103]
MNRVALAALALVCLANPAAAQSATDPVETVRAFYAKDDTGAVGFYAKRLRALYERDRREAGNEVGRLDFAFTVNGQDTEANWQKTLKLVALSDDHERAQVQATFRNFTPQDLRYDLVREDGRWLIADVRSMTGQTWDLVTILSSKLP